jgi:hypothetical protein
LEAPYSLLFDGRLYPEDFALVLAQVLCFAAGHLNELVDIPIHEDRTVEANWRSSGSLAQQCVTTVLARRR